MLRIANAGGEPRSPQQEERSAPREWFVIVRNQAALISAVGVACFLAGVIYVASTPAYYYAAASLLIDFRQEDPLQRQRPAADAQTETTAIESHAQLITSDAIASVVVRQLDLGNDPEFVVDDTLLPLRFIKDAIAELMGTQSSPERDSQRIATENLVKALWAGRVGRTYIVQVGALTRDPAKSATIANAAARAYTEDQLNGRLIAAERSAKWLRARADELRQQALDADRAVQLYSSQSNRERAELRSLEVTAQTYRTLFESFMQQYTTTMQQQSFPITYARIITPAQPPVRKSHPRTILILLGSLAGGIGLGWLLGFARQRFYPTVRSEKEAEVLTNLTSLGVLPNVVNSWAWMGTRRRNILSYAHDHPSSLFADTIGSVKIALDLSDAKRHGSRVLGVVSAGKREGKTVLANNLAHVCAGSGKRTLLLDLDIRRAMSGSDPCGHTVGLRDVMSGSIALSAALVENAQTGLVSLACGTSTPHHSNFAKTVAASEYASVSEALSQMFEYIIVDLPDFTTAMDAHLAAAIVDASVVVCANGRTDAYALQRFVHRWEESGAEAILGVVLNRVHSKERRPVPSDAIASSTTVKVRDLAD